MAYSETTENKKNRDRFTQVIRGISIILVVLIHSKTGMQSSGNEQVYWVVLRQFINFAVPMFFFVSGFYAYKTLNRNWGVLEEDKKTPDSVSVMDSILHCGEWEYLEVEHFNDNQRFAFWSFITANVLYHRTY